MFHFVIIIIQRLIACFFVSPLELLAELLIFWLVQYTAQYLGYPINRSLLFC